VSSRASSVRSAGDSGASSSAWDPGQQLLEPVEVGMAGRGDADHVAAAVHARRRGRIRHALAGRRLLFARFLGPGLGEILQLPRRPRQ
jgi:hypothetical protein